MYIFGPSIKTAEFHWTYHISEIAQIKMAEFNIIFGSTFLRQNFIIRKSFFFTPIFFLNWRKIPRIYLHQKKNFRQKIGVKKFGVKNCSPIFGVDCSEISQYIIQILFSPVCLWQSVLTFTYTLYDLHIYVLINMYLLYVPTSTSALLDAIRN